MINFKKKMLPSAKADIVACGNLPAETKALDVPNIQGLATDKELIGSSSLKLSPMIADDSELGPIIDFPVSLKPVELTEDDVAEDFANEYLNTLRFDHHAGKWFRWTDIVWAGNDTQAGFDYARHLCRKHRKGGTKLSSRKAAEGVETMARRDQRLAVTSEIWNRNPLLLGTPAGTVDLTTGVLMPPNAQDFITALTNVGPAPNGTPHPAFSQFLKEATDGDQELQRFLQQWCGYCLTGLTREHALLFIFGPGGNGKSVLQNLMGELLHDYSKAASMETFVSSKYESHTTGIAMLNGARLVVASETEKAQAWSEAKINRLTGGDSVTARFMRKDNFTFVPQFKLMIVGNHKPQLKTVNDAARRRIKIVPFLHKPGKPDRALTEKLLSEGPAILRWMITGCLDWLKNGLVEPAVVEQATMEYFEEQDVCAGWIDECCATGAGLKAKANALYVSWCKYALSVGEDPGSHKTLAEMLSQRGFEKKKSGSAIYLGICPKELDA